MTSSQGAAAAPAERIGVSERLVKADFREADAGVASLTQDMLALAAAVQKKKDEASQVHASFCKLTPSRKVTPCKVVTYLPDCEDPMYDRNAKTLPSASSGSGFHFQPQARRTSRVLEPRSQLPNDIQQIPEKALSIIRYETLRGFCLPDRMMQCCTAYLETSSLLPFGRVSRQVQHSVRTLLSVNPDLRAMVDEYIRKTCKRLVGQKVWVAVRVKPSDEDACGMKISGKNVDLSDTSYPRRESLQGSCKKVRSFHFDCVFDQPASQEQVWSLYAGPLVRCIANHESACVFAYGQTGSGKTHSMFGSTDSRRSEGISYRAIRSVGSMLRCKHFDERPSVRFSFVEVYNECVHDLLACRAQIGRASCANVCPSELPQRSSDPDSMETQMFEWLKEGAALRSVGETVCNAHSSRSHAIATLHICWPDDGEKHLHLVDLAGSERAGQHALSSSQLNEGKYINLSLSTLGRVVSASTKSSSEHVPIRDSTLTWLLKDSILGIGARAFLLATVNPIHHAETLSTLGYAQQYSILKSNLVHEVKELAKQRSEQKRAVDHARITLRDQCTNTPGPSGGRKWTEELLKADSIRRLVLGAGRIVMKDPWLKNDWSSEHESKGASRDAGILQSGPNALGLVEMYFPSTVRGQPPTILKFPAAALEAEDVDKPENLIGALEDLMREQEVFRQISTKLREEDRRLKSQQMVW